MMQTIIPIITLLLGALLYRGGRKDGEAGRVTPLLPRRRYKNEKKTERLLEQVERYDGGGRQWKR